ncbi:MAG TPA: peptidylprolyl isomerase, partial [Vicinamibacterales bacterium]|nr:peptidylprolyl isomerase [Vicinamibacterales bacterium]
MIRSVAVMLVCAVAALSARGAGVPGVGFERAELRKPASLTERAPAVYRAAFDTTKGSFVVEVHRAWAPLGADRFYNLVKYGFYNDCRFFRVIDGLVAQTGMNGDA